jgi:hypothetical protein
VRSCSHRPPEIHYDAIHSVFVFETDHALPEALLSFVRLLLLSGPEWTKARDKSKLPKPRPLDKDGARIVCSALRARLREYASTLEVREHLFLATLGRRRSPA